MAALSLKTAGLKHEVTVSRYFGPVSRLYFNMQVNITNPEQNTLIFTILLIVTLLITVRRRDMSAPGFSFMGTDLTQELKGFAIIGIILSHIGYFLVTDHRFLFPLSVMAGVCVNLFLFLSGFGLTASQLKNNLSIPEFYKKRLLKLFIPFWFMLVVFLILYKVLLNVSFSSSFIVQSVFGIFTSAQIMSDFNSPLWYFSFILFYYLVYPILFFKKHPYYSAATIFLSSILLVVAGLPINKDILNLYASHAVAFPLGVFVAAFVVDARFQHFRDFLKNFAASGLKYYLILGVLIFGIGYTAIHSAVGQGVYKEQLVSTFSMFMILFLFMLKRFKINFLSVYGKYSYEIYLLHWPILYRFDFLYLHLPAYLATFLYLIFFLGVAYLVSKLLSRFS
jgi:peptidoglycan/LPS O-acetylase OafA/YrhL